MATIIRKDPDAKLDYALSWSNVFDSTDTLATVVWTVPAGLTKESQTESALSSTIVLSGGVAGTSYTLIALQRARPVTLKIKRLLFTLSKR